MTCLALKFLLVFASFSFSYVRSQSVGPRIVGGYNVTSMNGFKHQVSLRSISADRTFGGGHLCGGSLIDLKTVLTAAHCVHDGETRYYSASNYVVAMGGLDRWTRDNNTLYFSVLKVAGHRKFNPNNFAHDIALLTLTQSVPVNHPTVQPILLSTQSPAVGQLCQISGWGKTLYEGGIQPNRLMAANLNVNAKKDCNKKSSYDGAVLSGQFCAGPFTGPNIVDSCQGDSGEFSMTTN